LCDAIKVVTKVFEVWNDIKSGFKLINGVLLAVDLIPGIPQEIVDAVKNVKGLLDSAMDCATLAMGDASSMFGCMQIGCKATNAFNSLCNSLTTTGIYKCEPIKQDQVDKCYCSLASVGSSINGLDIGGTAKDTSGAINDCFCGARPRDESNGSGGLWTPVYTVSPETGGGGVEYKLSDLCDNNPKK